ncbi:MAG TPA: ester cyclase [Dehalococcoidia bacterium]|nr:ester cyclase [Dehalococcoidia bacterium]
MPVSQEQMRAVLQEHVDAENARDDARVMATYGRNGPVFEDVAAGVRYTGDEIVSENYRHLWDGFPGLERRITRWTFGEDSAVIELTLSGVHDGGFRGIPATGKRIEFRVIAHFQFDDEGRIAQETTYYDRLTFMRQLRQTD